MMYVCKFCGTEIDWDGADERRGTIWGCEESGCGKEFCRACFDEKFGSGIFYKMTQEDDIIRCPDCFENMRVFNNKEIGKEGNLT